MMPVSYPFIEITIDPNALTVVAERAPGVVAVVGESATGTAVAEVPTTVEDAAEVNAKFGANTRLGQSLKLALAQSPRPSKFYGVKANGSPPSAAQYTSALAALDAADDVTFVSLANEPADLSATSPTDATAKLAPLKQHVEDMSDAGQKRIGVAMVNPTAKSTNDVTNIKAKTAGLRGAKARMVLVAARGAVRQGTAETADIATASMAAFAGYAPHISMLLKPVAGITFPLALQFSPGDIKGLSDEEIVPLIDPALISGDTLHFGEGTTYTGTTALQYIDIVRVLDAIEFRLKAGLVGSVGDARITKAGLSAVKARIEGILGSLVRSAVIDDFGISIPVLDALFIPDNARTPADTNLIATSRGNRRVEITVSITYGPAVHLLRVTLAPKF